MSQPTAHVSADELADFMGVSIRTISDLARREIVVRAGGTKYELRASLRAYCRHLRDTAAARGTTSTVSEERRRLLSGQADLVEVKAAVARGAMLPAGDVEAVWASAFSGVRTRLLSVPGRLAGLSAADRAMVDAEIRQCLTELAESGL